MTARATRLSDLGLTARAGRDPALSGLTADSRAVRPGMLFAALAGSAVHGAQFIAMAIEQGATAILTDAGGAKPSTCEALKTWLARAMGTRWVSASPVAGSSRTPSNVL